MKEDSATADAAGETLLAEIFRPLVADFRGVLESLGVLDGGQQAEAGLTRPPPRPCAPSQPSPRWFRAKL